jgi:hypothetical protein
MAFSIRLSEEERTLAEKYAQLHSITLEEAFKKALFELIEDEFDLKEYEKAYAEYKKEPLTYTLDEVIKDLDLA